MKKIPNEFTRNPFTCRLIFREAGVAIYELTHKGSGKVNNYEVVIIRQHKADNDFIKVKAGDEYLPSTSEWASMDGHSPLLNSQTTKPNISFMNVLWINQEVTLPLTKSVIDKQVEAAEIMGRVCYKSEPKGDPIAFLSRIINRGHESVIEHINIPAVLSTDRAVTHQLVRHRHMSISMESQRYVNYDRKGIICFVRPQFFSDEKVDPKTIEEFKNTCQNLAEKYVELVQGGLPPEEARGLLPNCTATVIGVTANLREWRHIFRMRLDGAAQPQIRALLLALRQRMELKYDLAWAFKDIPVDTNRLHSVPEL
jgi:thymidylate synthase (FAD)